MHVLHTQAKYMHAKKNTTAKDKIKEDLKPDTFPDTVERLNL